MSPRFVTKSGVVLTKGDIGLDMKVEAVRITSRWAKGKTYDTLHVTILVPDAVPSYSMDAVAARFSKRRLASLARGEALRKFPASWTSKPSRVGQLETHRVESWTSSSTAYKYVFKRTQRPIL
jgi:hypothetical protein